jgi:hypothetical protein
LLTASFVCAFFAFLSCLQRLQLSVFDEGNRGYLQQAQLHRFLEAMVPTAPMLQNMEVWPFIKQSSCAVTSAQHTLLAVVTQWSIIGAYKTVSKA